jgi:flavin reductase (DIM6/NTAB) family NADH-FMN oxidoreductase RutF
VNSRKEALKPNTTLYPVPVVIVTCGIEGNFNLFTLNRIASCNAEPPMLSISVRPSRASHDLIDRYGEFVVNIPWPELELLSDFVGTTTITETHKWDETGVSYTDADFVTAPLLSKCPVNIECRVVHRLRLPSHSLFVAEVLAVHADRLVLNERNEVDFQLAKGGIPYRSGTVRERPVDSFRPGQLLNQIHAWRDAN